MYEALDETMGQDKAHYMAEIPSAVHCDVKLTTCQHNTKKHHADGQQHDPNIEATTMHLHTAYEQYGKYPECCIRKQES